MSILKIKDSQDNWVGVQSIKGEKGDPFTYADFTPEQLESLKGKDGISPTVSVASDTSDDYRLSFTDETHTVTTPNLIPEAEKIFDVYPTDTASGSIASFPDGADDIPLKSCIVQIEPVQDLHGYDHPWLAGGGKNTLDPESLIEQYPSPAYGLAIARSGEWITINGAYSGDSQTPQFRIMKKKDDSTFDDTYFAFPDSNSSNNIPGWISKADSNKTLTIGLRNMTQGTTYNIRFRIMGVTDTTRPTDWAPYENICPISGWTGCEVQRTGKNLLNLVESEMISSGWNRIFPISLKAGTYIISCQNQFGASTKGAAVALVDDNATTVIKWLSWYDFGDSTFVGRATTITEEEASKIKNLRFSLRASGATYNDIVQSNIKLELGSTPTPYEPYTGQTYPITFPTEAGTVYGAYVDVINGELVVDRAMVVIDGVNKTVRENGTTSMTSQAWFPGAVGKAYGKNNFISDRFATGIGIAPGSMDGRDNSIGVEFLLPADIPNNSTALNQWFADNPTQLCYKLAEPITYPLTPTEIKTLLGTNNIWSDTGDVGVEYRADVTKYIDRKITEAVSALT